MMQQARDFLDECEALHALVRPLSDDALLQATAFKGWTINDVIGHLHTWNWAAYLSLTDELRFLEFFGEVEGNVRSGTLRVFEKAWLKGLQGHALLDVWHDFYGKMASGFGAADPSMRVKWAGPDMSVRSSITARFMETWAHAQEIFDVLGVVRHNGDRIRNIVVLGVNTYGWTFRNRGEPVPDPMPHIRLTAPSGDLWEYGTASGGESISGLAEEFCQVVTQTRNIADTRLRVIGPNATAWMAKAQCFAGPPEQPPAPGARTTASDNAVASRTP